MKFTYREMASLAGHENIMRVMRELGVVRFIGWTTPTVRSSRDARSFATVVPPILTALVMPKAKKELIAIARIVQDSGLDGTLVRFLAPTDAAFTGNIAVGFGDKRMHMTISRADIAAFKIQQVNSSEYMHAMPIIGGAYR